MSGTGWPSESRVQHPNYYIRMPTCYRSGISATSLKDVDTDVYTTPKISYYTQPITANVNYMSVCS